MKYGNIELTGSLDVSGSFIVPSGTSLPDETSTPDGSLFYDTTDSVLCGLVSGSWNTMPTVAGSNPYTVPIEYLLVAGGGGGGSYGGGGAGGLLSSSLSSADSGSTFTVTVGSGGAGSGNTYSAEGTAGVNSTIAQASITTITTLGGGGGGDNLDGADDGGSGGGGSDGPTDATGGSGTVGQGNDGGSGTYTSSPESYQGGGGGGAGTAGGNASQATGGNGGNGLPSNITGTSVTRAGGGGGVVFISGHTPGTAGSGGGGAGGSWNTGTSAISSATAGTVNTGGGGGSGQTGGSGVAIFAYDSGSFNCAGGIVGDAGNGRKYNQFNESGTFKVGNTTTDFQIVSSNLLLNFDAGNFASRGTSTATDLSGNGNNGTVGNATLNNYYYSFNGSNSYITAPPTSFVSSAYSVETWLYKTSIDSTYDCIFAFGYEMQSYFRSNFIEFYIDTGGGGAYEVSGLQLTGLSAATWYHYTVTDNGSGTVKMYLNGGTGTNTTTYTGNPGVYSGTPRIGDYPPSAGSYPFNGNIAQFRIYTKALTDAEVLQNYNATKTNFI